jgi:hypothetical protein
MNWILIKLLERKLKRTKKHADIIRVDSSIIAQAYDNMAKSLDSTLLFLNAENKR